MNRRLALVLAAGGLLLGVAPVLADDSITAPDSADAWYRATPACATPAGCLPAGAGTPPASQYPAKTLHVGVVGGTEEARTYLALDLSSVPPGATVTGGTLTLPVGPEGPSADGTLNPTTAKVKVCLVSDKVDDAADGSLDPPPAANCSSTTSATFHPAAGSAPATLTVDLTAFASALSNGSNGIALLPADGAAQTDNWDLSFSAHDRTSPPVPPPSAVLQTSTSSGGDLTGTPLVSDTPPPPPAPQAPTSFAAPPPRPVTVPAAVAPAPALAAPVVASAPAAAPAAPAEQPVAVVAGYSYPGVWLLPLGFLAGLGWLGRALTRELGRKRD